MSVNQASPVVPYDYEAATGEITILVACNDLSSRRPRWPERGARPHQERKLHSGECRGTAASKELAAQRRPERRQADTMEAWPQVALFFLRATKGSSCELKQELQAQPLSTAVSTTANHR
ncbi:hypothetical protein AAFF_G00161790 [Aldrovandia affinis]|uniref:Uncharacterized protein n=1 Tax=Aldrovandia affinis TaxID=143900 RepID=A0AAD7RMT8_9TELE|nr:hypothetical protein AAFF_G00161790 [Aldrovandia affinis]